MNENLKVSILVPVYKAEKFIVRCAKSLFEQIYCNLEIIFVDDCSPDGSVELIKSTLNSYPERQGQVKIVHHEKNKGVAAARNTLLANATGDYVLWVDADDFIDKRATEILITSAVVSNADIVCFGAAYFYDNGIVKLARRTKEETPESFIVDLLSNRTTTSVWGRLMRRSLFLDNDILFIEGLNLGEDFLVMLKVAYYSKAISMVEDILYYYNASNEQSIVHSYSEQKADTELRVLDLIDVFFKGKFDVAQYIEERRFGLNLYKLYCSCLKGDKQEYKVLKAYFKKTELPEYNFGKKKTYVFFLFCNSFFLSRIWSYMMKFVKYIVSYK